jgi:SAM-dependent MidA family methyltransferase
VQSPLKSIEQSKAASPGVPELVARIRAEIEQGGPITFAHFMELALYDAEHGYYSSGRARIGRGGDYITNVSIGPVFGELLAAQCDEIWRTLGCPEPFTIAEQGAHRGELAADVLAALKQDYRDCFAALRFAIIEPYGILRARQHERLKSFVRKIAWFQSVADLPRFTGVYFANELLDAFPFHLITRQSNGVWRERRVMLAKGGFSFVAAPFSCGKLRQFVAALPELPAPYATEVRLGLDEWVRGVAAKLERGVILLVDYGWSQRELYSPQRSHGTMQVRAQHRVLPSPLVEVGAADITAHINWSQICQAGEAEGLRVSGPIDQHHFLSGILTQLWRAQFEAADPDARRQLQTLLHPELMGKAFQALVLARGWPEKAQLAGLRFARKGGAAGD